MNETEKSKIQQFLADEIMMGAVKKALLSGVDYHKALKERNIKTIDDALLGSLMRSYDDAVNLVEDGFKKLNTYRAIEKKIQKPNGSR